MDVALLLMLLGVTGCHSARPRLHRQFDDGDTLMRVLGATERTATAGGRCALVRPCRRWCGSSNDTQGYDQQRRLIRLPAIQQETSADHPALIRTWLLQTDLASNQPETDAYQLRMVGAAGTRIPLGVIEWNADPSAPMPPYSQDPCWMEQFTTTALESMARAGVSFANRSFANQFDLDSYSGYGTDDMVDIYKYGTAKTQYAARLGMIQQIFPDATLPMPRCRCHGRPSHSRQAPRHGGCGRVTLRRRHSDVAAAVA